MAAGWQAFLNGAGRAARYWQVLLILFGASLAAALLLALPPALGLAAGLGQRPAIHDAADGLDAWLLLETLLSSSIARALEQAGTEVEPLLQQALLPGLVAALLAPLLAWLSGAFLTGGVLATYRDAPLPFSWRRFLGGCWRWFGVFLLLGLVQALALAGGVLLALVMAGLAGAIGGWLAALVIAVALLLAVLWLVALEYTRLLAVARGTRNLARTFFEAMAFVGRQPLAVLAVYGPALLLLALLHLGYGLVPYLPPVWWPLVLLAQQVFILARLAARLIRLAGGMALIESAVQQAAEAGPAERRQPGPA